MKSALRLFPLALLVCATPLLAAKRDLEYERIEQQLHAFENDPDIGGLAPAETARVRETLALMKAGARGDAKKRGSSGRGAAVGDDHQHSCSSLLQH